MFIAGTGGAVAAGRPIELIVDGVPHHSQAPRRIALLLATIVAVAGAWYATRSPAESTTQAAERKRLVARREKLLGELARLEKDRRSGRTDDRRFATRREELVSSLEQVYSALDTEEAGLDTTDRSGPPARLDGLKAT